MTIVRERYLDDTSEYRLAVTLVTRTGPMHSLLSNVPESERDAIGDVLVGALDEIQRRLAVHLPHPAVRP